MMRAAVFDLDDTLYDHETFVRGAYRLAAAAVAPLLEEEVEALFCALYRAWQGRTSRDGRIFSDALEQRGAWSPELEQRMVAAYRAHRPTLSPRAGVAEGLQQLREAGFVLGLITDGQPEVQRHKVRSLGLAEAFDAVVFTGDRGCYKPSPLGFRELQAAIRLPAASIVYIGDNPLTDFRPARELGWRTVRVLTGEYRELAHEPRSVDRTVPEVSAAIRALLRDRRWLDRRGASAG